MMKKMTLRRTHVVQGLLALLLGAGCAAEGDVDRTQANRLPKEMFADTWYVRSSIVDVPPSSTAHFIGLTGKLEKIVWDIQERDLYGYRSYAEFPGSVSDGAQDDNQTHDGEFRENPVIICPIEKHFDIKREYNPATGEQTNVIGENDEDRVWHERDFIRVNWARCGIESEQFYAEAGDPTKPAFYRQSFEDGPDAMRIEAEDGTAIDFENLNTLQETRAADVNYFDFVTQYTLDPAQVDLDGTTYPLCFFQINGQDFSTTSCGPTDVKVRTSFLKAKPRNFEPVVYSDVEMAKFGYFRTERLVYDRHQGFTESGRIYLANVHNIWQAAYETNSDGSYAVDENRRKIRIPLKEREAKPIVYHLSPRFPCEMIASAQTVAQSWNRAFRRSVAVAQELLTDTQGSTTADLDDVPSEFVPDMFVLNLNGWEQREAGDDWSCDNLEYDESRATARIGDLRYNMLAWVADPQVSGPLGYGPSSADPETGEIIAGMAYNYGAAVDRQAQRALDVVRLLNEDLDLDNITSGSDVVNYIESNRPIFDPRAIDQTTGNLRGAAIRDVLLSSEMQAKLSNIRQNGLESTAPGTARQRREKVRGTELEHALMHDEIVSGLASGTRLSDDNPAELSPLDWLGQDSVQLALARKRQNYAMRNSIWLAEFADDAVTGLAKSLWEEHGADNNYENLYQALRSIIFRAVAEHEVGHTVGLRHNFAGSYDAVNYKNSYWTQRAQPNGSGNGGLIERNPLVDAEALSFDELLSQATHTGAQQNNRMREYQYSSVMDYAARFNGDIHGLGKYDEAAVTFAYAGAVEAFESSSANARRQLRTRFNDCSPRFEGSTSLAAAPLLEEWHYSSIWNLLGGNEGLSRRVFRHWSDVKAEQVAATKACRQFKKAGGDVSEFISETVELPHGQTELGRPLEVPYLFCGDEFVGSTVSCQLWDQGADPFEITKDVIDRYQNYYFFNNYRRDQYGFNAIQVFLRAYNRYFSYLPNIYQHWLFRVGLFGVDDINQENYWTMAMLGGFNELINVVATPPYGTYCRTENGAECQANGSQVALINTDTTPTELANRFVIDRGVGRNQFSSYDFDSGYYYHQKITEVGHFWEYIAAIQALTQSEGTFIGVELASDFRTYLVPYFILFDAELTRVFEGIIGEKYEDYAPRLVDGEVQMSPATVLSLSNGDLVDPLTGRVVADSGGPILDGQLINLDNWFTQQYYALFYGMADFRSTYSLRFAERFQVFLVGSGEEVEPGPTHVVETCTDPIGGQTYGTLRDAALAPGDLASLGTAATRAMVRCQFAAFVYSDLIANDPTNPNLSSWRSELNDSVEWLNFMRSLYRYFGFNIT